MPWRYYNRNPKDLHEEDCVCRAISTALGLDYHVAGNLIQLAADAQGCEPLCVCCYHRLLEGVYGLNPVYCDFEETVREVAERYPNRKLIIRVEGHLTCALYGVVTDIWDCSEELVDRFWVV